MSRPVLERDVAGHLFADPSAAVFAVLDGASVPNLPRILWEQRPERACLVKGELQPEEAAAAPWLVRLEPGGPTSAFLLDSGWGRHWGIFAVGPPAVDLRRARNHFRSFLVVRLPDGRVANLRYFDPRVFRVYLPTLNAEEADTVFGPSGSYFMEDRDSAFGLWFRRSGNRVRQERVALGGE